MNPGTYLVAAALFLLVAAYVGSPLRRIKVDPDKVIEQWVSDVRNRLDQVKPLSDVETIVHQNLITEVVGVEQVNFCPQCGRRVEPDHRFCPGCGTPLPKGVTE